MSRELGFRILNVDKQFVLPVAEVDRDVLARLQSELGFTDLTTHDGQDPNLVRALASIGSTAATNAENWRLFGPELAEHFEELREDLEPTREHAAMDDLREAVRAAGGDARW